MKGFSLNKPSNNQPAKEKIAVEGVLCLLMMKVMNAAFLPNVAHDEMYENFAVVEICTSTSTWVNSAEPA